MVGTDVSSNLSFGDEEISGIDSSELSVLESALARTVEDRLESNTSAVSAAVQMRRNLEL